jgi:hypothetical protein
VNQGMCLQTIQPSKSFITLWAIICLHLTVYNWMSLQMIYTFESSHAQFTHVWLLPCVSQRMSLQFAGCNESLSTLTTYVWKTFSDICSLVHVCSTYYLRIATCLPLATETITTPVKWHGPDNCSCSYYWKHTVLIILCSQYLKHLKVKYLFIQYNWEVGCVNRLVLQ